jgi:hypothetical protein
MNENRIAGAAEISAARHRKVSVTSLATPQARCKA